MIVSEIRYEIDDILPQLQSLPDAIKTIKIDGTVLRITRVVKLVKHRGITCSCCNRDASHFSVVTASEKTKKGSKLITFLSVVFDHYETERVIDNRRLAVMTCDHIIPESLGGIDSVDNYQLMCKACNCKKGNQLVNQTFEVDWLDKLTCKAQLRLFIKLHINVPLIQWINLPRPKLRKLILAYRSSWDTQTFSEAYGELRQSIDDFSRARSTSERKKLKMGEVLDFI